MKEDYKTVAEDKERVLPYLLKIGMPIQIKHIAKELNISLQRTHIITRMLYDEDKITPYELHGRTFWFHNESVLDHNKPI